MNAFLRVARKSIARLSRVPWAFDALRYVLEGGYRAHRKLIAEFVKSSPGRTLDCGCGTGIYAREFSKESYVGIDLSPEYIARARDCYPGYDFRVMDATRMDFPDESFDAAIISGVLHHLGEESAHRVLAEISRVLKSDGKLLVWEDVPAKRSWNIVGHVVHRLDVGAHIRESESYENLLAPHFRVERTSGFRSGFMDYAAFQCVKPSPASRLPEDPQIPEARPVETSP